MSKSFPSHPEPHPAEHPHFLGPSLRLVPAAVRCRKTRHVDFPAHGDPALRRPVLRLCGLSCQPSGDLHLCRSFPRQKSLRPEYLRVDLQQPHHGLGRALRTGQPAPRIDPLHGAHAAVRIARFSASNTSSIENKWQEGLLWASKYDPKGEAASANPAKAAKTTKPAKIAPGRHRNADRHRSQKRRHLLQHLLSS